MKKNLFRAFLLCLVSAVVMGCPEVPEEPCEVCGKEPCECETEEVCKECGKNPCECETPTPPEEKTFSMELKTAEADYIELAVTAPAEVEIAYLLETQPNSSLNAAVMFATGTTAKVKDGDVLKITDGVSENTSYYLYAVAKLDDKNFSDIVTLEFTTKGYEFKDLITVVDTYYDGYKVHLTIPEDVKEKGNVIRYTAASLAIYNVNKSNYGDALINLLDAQSIVSNGDPWGNYVKNDSTIIYNSMNEILLDESGNPVLDVNGNTIDIHNPITPGEPSVFLAGECRWGTFDEMGDVLGYYYGITGSAYVVPLFDRQNYEWTGVFEKKEFFAKEPTECEATVEIEIPEEEISVTDANIYFNMEDGVRRYFYMVLDDATYNQVISVYLDGHEEWFQWFLTSFIAFYEWGIGAETESMMVNAAQSFYEPLVGGDTYHVVCTVMGDDAGATQRYIHKTFTTKEKTKRAPVIEVKAVNTDDPYNATFNIKAPSKDIAGAYWACNYSREFQLMFNSGYTYETILKGNYSMSSEELAAINSDEGLTLSFPTLDGETMRFAIYGCNDEYTFNILSKDASTEGAGWANYYAPMAPTVDEIDSDLYEALSDDWTATATIAVNEELPDGSVASKNITYSSKVTISDAAPVLPDKVEEHVYGLYGSTSRDDVDGMFDELWMLCDMFTEYRLVGQNRMLCTGFMDYDFYEPSRIEYKSPYDLFKAEDYSSVDVPQLVYDFGPKWFLEVQEDGSVIVPFSSLYLPPMHAWPGYPFYVGGVGKGADGSTVAFYDSNETIKGFPVEVSDDLNTITIKPIVLTDGSKNYSYYMNALGFSGQYGSMELIATVNSDIVLTRGWTETKSAPANYVAAPSKVKAASIDGKPARELPKARVYKSLTDFSKIKPLRQYKVDETPNVVTMDMVNNTTQKILNNEL